MGHGIRCFCREANALQRIGIYEVVKITKPIALAIMDGANSLDLSKAARAAGFADLRQSALSKCAQGLISLEEVGRVTTD